jgi:hypothetical protein
VSETNIWISNGQGASRRPGGCSRRSADTTVLVRAYLECPRRRHRQTTRYVARPPTPRTAGTMQTGNKPHDDEGGERTDAVEGTTRGTASTEPAYVLLLALPPTGSADHRGRAQGGGARRPDPRRPAAAPRSARPAKRRPRRHLHDHLDCSRGPCHLRTPQGVGRHHGAWLDPASTRSKGKSVTLGGRFRQHAYHIASLVGWEHVGIGSDLDGGLGRDDCPTEIDTVADLVKIGEVVPAAHAAAVLGGNWIRFLGSVLPGTEDP